MFVWGGRDAGGNPLASGGLYDPAKKVWTPTSGTGAPAARYDATAVWDDVHNTVLVWGGRTAATGYLGDGFAYDPAKNAWSPACNMGSGPSARADHTAVWVKTLTGVAGATSGMIIWGGNKTGSITGDGAICDPGQNAWVASIPLAMQAPPPPLGPGPRVGHAAVWDSNSRMVVFGGDNAAALGDTWAYVPSLPPATWNGNSNTNPLGKRYQHTANWDPVTMTSIFFGGSDGTAYFGDAASLNGAMWTALGGGGPNPEGRIAHTAVILSKSATSSQLVVFGGENQNGFLATGWSLATSAGSMWTALPSPGPSARANHTAVANGATMIVWGGDTASGPTATGGVYTAQ
jgi:hypothetical protein